MTSLNWQDSPEKAAPHRATLSSGDPWFGISVGLMGVIVGFIVGNIL
ncbi:hypothetical protein HYZ98_02590 [Candidatus Peregrinibacteria bacterium]|nr:hypothetical protein [Candidatus Peregrinibacteria bacterium]